MIFLLMIVCLIWMVTSGLYLGATVWRECRRRMAYRALMRKLDREAVKRTLRMLERVK